LADEIVGTYIGEADNGCSRIRLSEPPQWIEEYHAAGSEDSPFAIIVDEANFAGISGSIREAGLFTNWNGSNHALKRQEKAKEFLKSWLTHQEYEDLQDGNLIIPSKIFPDRTYKLKATASQMIEVYTSGILDHKLCAVAKDPRFENDDTVLAKILMLKTNEEQFLKIAEKHPIQLDSGFGRGIYAGFGYVLSTTSANSDSLTLTWTIDGDITVRAEGDIQPGQMVTTNDRGEAVPFVSRTRNGSGAEAEYDPTTGMINFKLRSRHND
jgi:hypothetical protein